VPCPNRAFKRYDKSGELIVTELECGGKCDDDGKEICKVQDYDIQRDDDTFEDYTISYCTCNLGGVTTEKELDEHEDGCRIAVKTTKKDDKIIDVELVCVGKCPDDGKRCTPVETGRTPTDDGGTLEIFECQCIPEGHLAIPKSFEQQKQ